MNGLAPSFAADAGDAGIPIPATLMEAEEDFWSSHFAERSVVPWKEFAVHVLLEHAREVKNLTVDIAPVIGGHFDVDADGIVSRKECVERVGRREPLPKP